LGCHRLVSGSTKRAATRNQVKKAAGIEIKHGTLIFSGLFPYHGHSHNQSAIWIFFLHLSTLVLNYNKKNTINSRTKLFARTTTAAMRTHKKRRVGPWRRKKKKRREIFQADAVKGRRRLRTCVTTMVELTEKKFVEKGRWDVAHKHDGSPHKARIGQRPVA
jgi:hypothetical protein